ncbi:GEVED domain-containing protein [Tenacibaculum agarivorans]|uniref:GEVED domain-containing protein n=1 Tax=Tenacibaculum agarivorans TaxID=1908389 RepID=UPI00094B8B77|nr:GEVED domain-containing protein [Tenacibaculum agarivorans]
MKNRITPVILGIFLSISMLAQQKPTQVKRDCNVMELLEESIQKDPSIKQRMIDMEANAQKRALKMKNLQGKIVGNVIQIPVVVHVLHTNSTNNISTAQIQSQLDVLNADFRRTNSDRTNKWSQAADSQIEFYLAKVDPNGNPTSGITRKRVSKSTWNLSLGDGDDLKKSSEGGVNPWNTAEYLNMWIVDNLIRNTPTGTATILGFAQFPWDTDASTDGVVMSDQYFGTTGTARAPFDGGRTTTHEVGHYFGLRHIWGDGACGVDDGISDTPESDAPNYGCSAGHTSCGSEDMVQNYMDYSDDSCMNLFTQGQKNVMRSFLEAGGARRTLALSDKTETGGGSTTDPTPVTYCGSKGNRSSFEWIDNVELGGIRNRTASNGGYGDFTSQVGTLQRGASSSMIVSAGFSGQAYTEFWSVWIDFNQNGTFEGSERVVFGSSSSANNLSATVNVPSSARLGRTRMRVSMKYNAEQTPCETFADGEVEDYTVNITTTGGSSRVDADAARALGNETAQTFAAFPNPADTFVEVRLTNVDASLASYKIINTVGQTVQSGSLDASQQINVSNLTLGIYILEVNDGQKSFMTKLVKE